MENTVETTESTETSGIMGVESNTQEVQSNETTENVNTEDKSYDSDYKDDYTVPTHDEEPKTVEKAISPEQKQEEMEAYIRENYDLPEKFKDINSLVNSYKHLEGKMGSLKGAPETYEIDEDIFDNYSEDMLGSLTDAAREMGIDNDGMNKLLQQASKQSTLEADAKWEMEKHKLGQYADEELSDAVSYLNANFTPEVSEQLQGMVQTAEQFKALKTAVMSANKPTQPAQNQTASVAPSDNEIQKMLFAKDDFGNLRMESDSAYAQKVNGLMKSNW